MNFDIAIIGGGPAGATAAALLARAGLRVVLCERKTFPRHKVCGELLSSTAFPILQRLELLDRFHDLAGPPIRRSLILPSAGPTLETPVPPGPSGEFPRALSRARFDHLLLQCAQDAGAVIHQPAHVAAIHGSSNDGFTLRTSADAALRARFVVLAHGLPHSPLNGTGADRASHNAFICFKAHFAHCELPDDTIALAGAAGVYAGLVRTALAQSSSPAYVLAFAVRRSHLARLGPAADGHLSALLAANPAMRRIFSRARRITPWLASGPLVPGLRTLHHDGRFAIGNAAAELHPILGEGMALAMHSAATLADLLSENVPDNRDRVVADAAAHRYHACFVPEFTSRHRASRLLATLLTHPGLSDFSASLIQTLPSLLSLMTRMLKPAPVFASTAFSSEQKTEAAAGLISDH